MRWFIEGGPAMYAILLVDVLGLVSVSLLFALAVAARFSRPVRWPARVLSGLGLVGSGLPALVGLIGWLHGRSLTDQAVVHADEATREALRAAGHAMSLIPLQFGLGSWTVLGFLALIPFVVAVLPARGGAED